MKMRFVIIALLFSFSSYAQEKTIQVKFIEKPEIKIDGIPDEPVWQQADMGTDFWTHFPDDKQLATEQTEIRMLYDNKYLYISAKVYTIGNNYSTISLERDSGEGEANDNINFIFDTYSDRNQGFYFGLNPFGVVRDGLLSRGGVKGTKNIDLTWDTTWNAEAKIHDGFYTIEMRIPFFAFKFNENVKSWRFNCYRNDPQSQINSTWVKIPRNRELEDMGFMGTMVFEKPLKKSRNPIALIPYALGDFYKDFDNNTSGFNPEIGGDAKIPIGSSSNLDLTYNPDFSSTSPPEGSTNITRFELNVKEQRQFFLDNADLFANFGKEKQTSPFYSRRIGYGKDTLKNDIQVPIIAGARFTGKLNKNLRVGILDVQTAEDKENKIPSNNNLVVAVEQKILKKSNIAAFFINRQATGSPDYLVEKKRYNRVFGADFNYFSNNNSWDGKLYLHKSITPEAGNKDLSTGLILNYNSRKFTSETNARYVGGDFKSDLGFIKRTNTAIMNQRIGPKFYPKNKKINMIGIFALGGINYQPSTSTLMDYNYNLIFETKFRNQTKFKTEFSLQYTYLDKPFDPTKVPGAVPLPVGDYHYTDLLVKYTSNKARLFSYVAIVKGGTFYNGHKYTGKLTLNYRIQPIFNTVLKLTYDFISLPDPHPNATHIIYLEPSFNFTFTKKLFWNTDLQFNSQHEALGIYSRIQWRYRPLSDIFLIYMDNYHTSDFEPGYRAIFLKATFWLNI